MRGVICKRHVLTHPVTTIQSFGWNVFFKTLVAPRDQTFLSLITQTDTPHHGRQPAADQETSEFSDGLRPDCLILLDRCITLERRAQTVYSSLAERFGHDIRVAEFFATLSRQEAGHAELLGICRTLAAESNWRNDRFRGGPEAVPRLERQMDEIVTEVTDLDSRIEALRLVIRIESSEINGLFNGVLDATECGFTRKLRLFHDVSERHLEFIRNEIPKLEPGLADACRSLGLS